MGYYTAARANKLWLFVRLWIHLKTLIFEQENLVTNNYLMYNSMLAKVFYSVSGQEKWVFWGKVLTGVLLINSLLIQVLVTWACLVCEISQLFTYYRWTVLFASYYVENGVNLMSCNFSLRCILDMQEPFLMLCHGFHSGYCWYCAG